MNRTAPSGERPRLHACPLCSHEHLTYQFTHDGTPIVVCDSCGLLMRNPQPSDQELAEIYTDEYFLGSAKSERDLAEETNRLKQATAGSYLDAVESRLGVTASSRVGLKLLEVGSGLGNLVVEADRRGYQVTGIEYSEDSVRVANQKLGAAKVVHGSLETVELPAETFDVAVFADVLEHTRDPLRELRRVWRVLKPGGVLFIAVPSLDSWSARIMKRRWMEFKLEHLFFFDTQTIQSLLFHAGFNQVVVSKGWKILSPDYVIKHFDRFHVPVTSPLVRLVGAVTPAFLRRRHVSVVASGIDVVARRTADVPLAERPVKLTVVMPVFNEGETFSQIFEQVYAKSIPGVEIDLIIVESRSTDGTRELVQRIEHCPRVTVLYEERPRGKGHAVRAALAHATGDLILIQDADLEYDVGDYDQLIEPIVRGRAAFVLGVRHGMDGTAWKMRHFTDQVVVAKVMNLGHVFFTTLFNVVYGQHMRDPFTMFKVFRRDCLYGLTFESNRFDFDWELVAKLVRAGYIPLEIPVNYESRSFSKGKKVSLWRDPWTFLRACFKYRFVPLGK
jgi:2-polyprenyl-3-methyl-5-hydroxy-6-metoxy-1,4-benzoquinol methylase